MVLKKLTLVLLSAILYISLCVAVIGSSMQVLLYPELYEKALDDNAVFDQIEIEMQEEGIIQDTVFVDHIENTTKSHIRNALAFIRGDTEEIKVNSVQDFFEQRVKSLPTCTGREQMCIPPGMSSDEFLQLVYEQQNIDPSDFDNIDISDTIDIAFLNSARQAVGMFRSIVITSIILSLFSVAMIILLNRKSVSAITEWLDADLFGVGVAMFAISFAVKKSLPLIIPESYSIWQGFLATIVFTVLDMMVVYGAGLVIIGIITLVLTVIYKNLNK